MFSCVVSVRWDEFTRMNVPFVEPKAISTAEVQLIALLFQSWRCSLHQDSVRGSAQRHGFALGSARQKLSGPSSSTFPPRLLHPASNAVQASMPCASFS